eukprot:TRINITY_DN5399_c0_g2_i1.p1 TRINITY_DN5399_c0_g2~~TRINITY_DN5399_c0_g2_i1.p1  ORF type:complete len:1189 (+),score=232.70 TRINITY_DN5399_c0_g2_i1:1205-4771(+)
MIHEAPASDESGRPNKNVHVNSLGIQFKFAETSPAYTAPKAYGITAVFDVFQFICSLIGKENLRHPTVMQLFGLQLLNLALETGGKNFSRFPSLVAFIQEELCHQLIQLGITNDLSVLAFSLRAILNLYAYLKEHLRIQLEGFLSEIYLDILQSKESSIEKQEVVLESLLQLCQMPTFMMELFLNYDINLHSSNIYEDLCEFLYKNSIPVRSQLHSIHILSLECLIAMVSSTHERCRRYGSRQTTTSERLDQYPPDVESAMQLRQKKRVIASGAQIFNSNPVKGIKYLQDNKVLPTPLCHTSVAEFLRNTPALTKDAIGLYLGEPGDENIGIMKKYIETFDFAGMSFDSSLRMFLESFRLPGEAQKIDRIMEAFSERFYAQCPSPFANASAAYVLAFSAILLNTDHHNTVIKRKMTLQEFMRNTSGINDGKDLPSELLIEIYNSITTNEIKLPGRVREEGGDSRWDDMMNRARSESKFTSLHPQIFASVPYYDREMFLVISKPIVAALSIVFDAAEDATLLKEISEGLSLVAQVAAYFQFSDTFDSIFMTLCKHTTFLDPIPSETHVSTFGCSLKAQISLKLVFSLSHKYGSVMREGWRTILDILMRLRTLNLLPRTIDKIDDFLLHGTKTPRGPPIGTSPKPSRSSFLSTFSQYLSLNVETPTDNYQNMEAEKVTRDSVNSCQLGDLIPNTKRIQSESLKQFLKSLVGAYLRVRNTDQGGAAFCMNLITSITLANRERSPEFWDIVSDFFSTAAFAPGNVQHYLVERASVCLLRICIRLLQKDEVRFGLFECLRLLTRLDRSVLMTLSIAEQIAAGILQLVQTQAQHIRLRENWDVIFSILVKVADHPTAYACVFEAITNIVQDPSYDLKASYPDAAAALAVIATHSSCGSSRAKKAVDLCGTLYLRTIATTDAHENLRTSTVSPALNRSFILLRSETTAHNTSLHDTKARSDVSIQDCLSVWLSVLKFFDYIILNSQRMDVRLYAVQLLQRIILAPSSDSYHALYIEAVLRQSLLSIVNGLADQEKAAIEAGQGLQPPLSPTSEQRDELLQRSYELLTKAILQFANKLSTLDTFHTLWFDVVSASERVAAVSVSELLSESVHERLKNIVIVLISQGFLGVCGDHLRDETVERVSRLDARIRLELSEFLTPDPISPEDTTLSTTAPLEPATEISSILDNTLAEASAE